MRLLRTYNLYLSSKNKDFGTTCEYDIIIPDLILESENTTELFKISLTEFSCYFNWYVINEGFNTLTFHNNITSSTNVIDIPEGNYSYQELAKTISQLYPPCKCSWDKTSNKMVFSFAQSHTLSFDGIYEKLGFNPNETPTGTTIVSRYVVLPLDTTHLLVNLNNLTPYHDALSIDNLSGQMKASNILGSVVINSPPFQLITYTNNNDNGIFTSDTKLNRLSFSITNQDGVILPFIPDHHIQLKVDVYEIVDTQYNEISDKLDNISRVLNHMWLSKAVRHYR